MAKAKKVVKQVEVKKAATSRTGYKRKSNKRIDRFGQQLKSKVAKALRAEAYASKTVVKAAKAK